MTNIFIDHLFEATFFKTVVNLVLLILCLYPVVGSFFWFAGSLSYRFLLRPINATTIGKPSRLTNNP